MPFFHTFYWNPLFEERIATENRICLSASDQLTATFSANLRKKNFGPDFSSKAKSSYQRFDTDRGWRTGPEVPFRRFLTYQDLEESFQVKQRPAKLFQIISNVLLYVHYKIIYQN